MSVKIEFEKRTPSMLADGFQAWQKIWRQTVEPRPHSYFLSWPWLEHWLTKVPPEVAIHLVRFEGRGARGACFLGHSRLARHGLIKTDSFNLNYTGIANLDKLTLEYNQIPGHDQVGEWLPALLDALPRGWDELHLPALDARCFPGNSLDQRLPGYEVELREEPSHYVDLTGIGPEEDSYLMMLSKKTRKTIRQAKKKISKLGDLHVEPAGDLDAALAIFDEMVALHQKAWQSRGLPGVFADPWYLDFHRTLIQKRFASGEIQLLRMLCGRKTLGCFYCFVWQGVVYGYQSGINYQDFGKYGPGTLCHALAIPFNASLGHTICDFLAGDTPYKRSLCTHANQMAWCTIQKPRLRFKAEKAAKSFRNNLKK